MLSTERGRPSHAASRSPGGARGSPESWAVSLLLLQYRQPVKKTSIGCPLFGVRHIESRRRKPQKWGRASSKFVSCPCPLRLRAILTGSGSYTPPHGQTRYKSAVEN
jgi:hypothetical protein